MQYIVIKRFKRNGLNLPYGTQVEEHGGVLFYNGKRICNDHSAVMREHFARDDDGHGLERGKLCKAIISTLQMRDDESKEDWNLRWEPVWNDNICKKYKKNTAENMFLWAIEFFNAPLFDLYHIARLVGAPI